MLKFKNFSLFLFFPEGTCPKLEAPTNGRKLGKSYGVGHEVHFLCDPGYEVVGSESRTCQESLVWSGQLTACRGNGLFPGLSGSSTPSPCWHCLSFCSLSCSPSTALSPCKLFGNSASSLYGCQPVFPILFQQGAQHQGVSVCVWVWKILDFFAVVFVFLHQWLSVLIK